MQTGVKLKRNTKRTGTISELRVAHDLVRAGYLVSIPFGENCRYDFVADDGCRLYRVQVKTGRLRKGVVIFNAYSSHSHRGGPTCRTYTDEIDYFAVFCGETDATYLIPIGELPVQVGALRVERPRNNQTSKMRWAADYLLFGGMSGACESVGNSPEGAVPNVPRSAVVA